MEQELFFKGQPFKTKYSDIVFRFKQSVNSTINSAGYLESNVREKLPDNSWLYDSFVNLDEVTSEYIIFRATIAGYPRSVTVKFEDMIMYEVPQTDVASAVLKK